MSHDSLSGHAIGIAGGHSAGAAAVEGPSPHPAAHTHGGHEGPVPRGVAPLCPHPCRIAVLCSELQLKHQSSSAQQHRLARSLASTVMWLAVMASLPRCYDWVTRPHPECNLPTHLLPLFLLLLLWPVITVTTTVSSLYNWYQRPKLVDLFFSLFCSQSVRLQCKH